MRNSKKDNKNQKPELKAMKNDKSKAPAATTQIAGQQKQGKHNKGSGNKI